MITFTVHEPSPPSQELGERADRLTFVKEGFAWLAFPWLGVLSPLLWLLFHRMWLVLLAFGSMAAVLFAGVRFLGLGESVAGGLVFGLSLVLALQANDLRRWTLQRRGYAELGVVTGGSREECEFRFLSAWLDRMAELDAPIRAGSRAGVPALPAPTATPKGSSDQIIGLFPRKGG